MSIGAHAFENCYSLSSITIPEGVVSVGYQAFNGCSSLIIYCEAASRPTDWHLSWNYGQCPVVWNCRNNEIAEDGNIYVVQDGVRYALKNNEATVAKQPYNVSGTICIPETITHKDQIYTVTTIGYNAFSGRRITKISLTASITEIVNQAFYGCDELTTVIFAKDSKLETIANYAFTNCVSLSSIVIPSSVTSIRQNVFDGCTLLKIVYYGGTVEQWDDISINTSWNSYLTSATRYYYSESNPFEGESAVSDGNYWHYAQDGVTPVIWIKETT